MNSTNIWQLGAGLLLLATFSGLVGASGGKESSSVQRGRYLVRIGGCNDCHTQGYSESAGQVPENRWLTGNVLGWRGPWGTTYPANLRLAVQGLDEKQWLLYARNQWRPPMPWFNLRDMSDHDLVAIFHYLRHLGPAGNPAPPYVPPSQEPQAPVVNMGG